MANEMASVGFVYVGFYVVFAPRTRRTLPHRLTRSPHLCRGCLRLNRTVHSLPLLPALTSHTHHAPPMSAWLAQSSMKKMKMAWNGSAAGICVKRKLEEIMKLSEEKAACLKIRREEMKAAICCLWSICNLRRNAKKWKKKKEENAENENGEKQLAKTEENGCRICNLSQWLRKHVWPLMTNVYQCSMAQC